jgi:hypothetical protein
VSLNPRAVYESDALGILMICAAAWPRRAVDRDDGVKRILVVDEAWKVLTRLGGGALAAGELEADALDSGPVHRGHPPALRPGGGRRPRQRAGAAGQGAALRLERAERQDSRAVERVPNAELDRDEDFAELATGATEHWQQSLSE